METPATAKCHSLVRMRKTVTQSSLSPRNSDGDSLWATALEANGADCTWIRDLLPHFRALSVPISGFRPVSTLPVGGIVLGSALRQAAHARVGVRSRVQGRNIGGVGR